MKTLIALAGVLLLCTDADATLTCAKENPGIHTCVESIDYAGQYEWSWHPRDEGLLYVATDMVNVPPILNVATFLCFAQFMPPATFGGPDRLGDGTAGHADDNLGSVRVPDIYHPTISVGMPLIGFGGITHMTTVECRTQSGDVILNAENEGDGEYISDDSYASWDTWGSELELYTNTDDQWSWWEYEVVWGCDGSNGDDYTWQYQESCW